MAHSTESIESFGLTQIGQIAVPAQDLDKAIAFYRDILRIRFLFQVPNMAFFDCGGVRLMLNGGDTDSGGSASVIYYKVEDLELAHAALSDRGVEFDAKPHLVAPMKDHDLWMAFLRDPDGNLIGLMSEKPKMN